MRAGPERLIRGSARGGWSRSRSASRGDRLRPLPQPPARPPVRDDGAQLDQQAPEQPEDIEERFGQPDW
jgi:hypothetical protein